MFSWSEDNIAELRRMHGKNYSFGMIGAKLGCSRNAAIGKAKRLGLNAAPYVRRKPGFVKQRAKETKPRVQQFHEVLNTGAVHSSSSSAAGESDPSVTPDWSRPGSHFCTMMDLTSETCRWPLWTDAKPERLYCGSAGADLEDRRPYCPCHSRMAYRRRAA